MDRDLVPTGRLRCADGGAYAELDWIGARTCAVDGPALDVLQAFLEHGNADAAHHALVTGTPVPAGVLADDRLRAAREALAGGGARIVLGARMFSTVRTAPPPPGPDLLPLDTRGAAQRWTGLLRWLLLGEVEPAPTRAELDDRVRALTAEGLLVPRPAGTALTDALPRRPLCQLFGMQRGTPLDRYYLTRFVEDVRPAVTPAGHVLDVGGETANRIEYRLHGVRRYDALDVAGGPGVTVVGDAADPGTVAAGSVDTVLLFNMLEHTPQPRVVVDNVHAWLRPGGTCLAMVPAAQRLHDFPRDYGRPSPATLAGLFDGFAEVESRSYGNLATAIGSLAGLAAEEFDRETLDEQLPDYPVAVCLRARKG